MKIALISDTHDHIERLAQALDIFAQSGAQALIHAGDVVSPFTAEALSAFDGPIRAVYGNCDGERQGLRRFLKSIADGPILFELGGRSFVLAHSRPQIHRDLFDRVDVAVVGHTHIPEQTHQNGALIINPGECCGRVSGQATVALLDSDNLSVELINLS